MSATIERRFTSTAEAGVEVRAAGAGGGPGTLVGYAATYYDPANAGTQFDLTPDIRERLLPGSLRSAVAAGRDIVSTVDHQDSVLLGRTLAGTLRLVEDKRGLRYEVDLPDTQAGRDIAVHARRGDIRGSSFEFVAKATDWSSEGGKRIRGLKDVEVHQVGPVFHPAYGATTAEVRSRIEAEASAALDPDPQSPEALKAKADADAIAIDAEARRRRLDLAERE